MVICLHKSGQLVRLAGKGTHAELMAAEPVYLQLYESQTSQKGGEGA